MRSSSGTCSRILWRAHPAVWQLMRYAGDDGTVAFDEVHPWVNAEGMLAACCVGRLATSATEGAPEVPADSSELYEFGLHPEVWQPYTVVSREHASCDTVLLRLACPLGAQAHGCTGAEAAGAKGAGADAAGAQGRQVHVGHSVQVRHRRSDGVPLVRSYTIVGAPPAGGALPVGGAPWVDAGASEASEPSASASHEPVLCLLVRRVSGLGGALSRWLCARRVGDRVDVRGPRGVGLYDPRSSMPLRSHGVLVDAPSAVYSLSAGSGLVPTLALLRALASSARPSSARPVVHVVHCARTAAHVPLLTEMRHLLARLGGSLRLLLKEQGEEQQGEEQQGEQGGVLGGGAGLQGSYEVHVGETLDAERLSRWIAPPAEGPALLVCGRPAFNHLVGEWAAQAGHCRAAIHFF